MKSLARSLASIAVLCLPLVLGCQQAEEPGPGATISADDQLDIREDMCENDRDPESCREQVAELRKKLEEMRSGP